MLTEQPNKVLTIFSATYKPQVGFARRLSEVAEAVNRKFNEKLWLAHFNSYVFREPEHRVLCAAQYNQLFFQTLGLAPWRERAHEYAEIADMILNGMAVQTIDRISFKAIAFLDLKMTHEEIVDQVFGSFLVEKEKLSPLSAELNDNMVGLFGQRKGHKFRLQLTPQSSQDAKTSFFGFPNLDLFAENRLIDVPVREMWLGIADRPCLNVEAEIWDEKVSSGQAAPFIRDSATMADELAWDAVNHLRSLPVRQRK